MKNILPFVFCFMFLFTQAQQNNFPEKCGTMHLLETHQNNNPQLQVKMQEAEKNIQHWIKNNKGGNKSVITIPVVVHVVYVNNNQNISDEQIKSQIDALNADYRRLNTDKTNTRPVFDTIAADIEIEFCLTATDTNGNFTTGIIRKESPGEFFGLFTPFDGVKSSNNGIGSDPWPTDQYLNIWVCPLIPGLLGYAQFPGDNPATDGVVITTNAFGTIGTVQPPSTKGRTATHEIGHWLGLRHIWGDGPCDSTDYVDDTPNADASSSGCDLNKNTCVNDSTFWGNFNPPDMVENFMDYSEDVCMNAFTKGQKTRMWAAINTLRPTLLTTMNNKNCYTVGINSYALSSNEIQIFPIPAENNFTITLNEEFIQSITVYNLLGEVVFSKNINLSSFVVDTQNWKNGIYTINVKGEKNNFIRKIAVNKH